jgi:diguanylate cyclase (GGDEF)-like protein
MNNAEQKKFNEEILDENQNLKEIIEVARQISSGLDIENILKSVNYILMSKFHQEFIAFILKKDIDDLTPIIYMFKGGFAEKIELHSASILTLTTFFEDHEFNQISFDEFCIMYEDSKILKELSNYCPEFLIPLKSYKGIVGIYLQGKKNDLSPYIMKDIQFCIDLLSFASISIENSNLYREAIIDRMTKLYTHHQFQETLEKQIKIGERYGNKFSLIMFDIDNFKSFNDKYGHLTGDEIIKTIAAIMKKSIRSVDFPARYGGEEFMLILPEITIHSALKLAERLRKVVESHKFTINNNVYNVTISLGVAEFDPLFVKHNGDIIDATDQALYDAKHNGRNRVSIAKYSNEQIDKSKDK